MASNRKSSKQFFRNLTFGHSAEPVFRKNHFPVTFIDMSWIVRKVIPQDNYTLLLRFDDGKQGVYDMWPIIQQEDGGDDSFVPLEDIGLFMQAFLDAETVGWPGDISIAAEELYENCMTVQEYEDRSAEEDCEKCRDDDNALEP